MVEIIIDTYDLKHSKKLGQLIIHQVKMLCEMTSPEQDFIKLRIIVSVVKE